MLIAMDMPALEDALCLVQVRAQLMAERCMRNEMDPLVVVVSHGEPAVD